MDAANPIMVELTRGDAVESRHRGAAVVAHASGAVLESWGDVERPVFARSAAKPIQALPLIETGAAARFRLTDVEIALACASHSAEPEQTLAIESWLGRIGLSAADLECGAHMPRDEGAARALHRAGIQPTALHNNCSGKHAGFLTAAVHLGEPTRGYVKPAHPAQRRVTETLGEMGDFDPAAAPVGTDGCGIPVVGMALAALARAMARMANPEGLDKARAAACRRIVAAMTGHPRMVAGKGRFDTVAMAATRGAVATKTGAEGVYAAILPAAGLGVALKIDDGATRAAEVAMAALLDRLGVLDAAARNALAPFIETPLRNWSGKRIGTIRTAPGWPG